MADDDQKLTEKQVQQAMDWIKEKSAPGGPTCPSCKNRSWQMATDFATPMTLSPTGGVMFGGEIYPQAMIICKTCAHTMFFNAALMGIVQEKDKKKESKAKKNKDTKKQEAKNG